MKKRPKISDKVSADIIFRADRKCCVCKSPDSNPSMHHIDGNPSNNNPDNLAPLCPNCQDKTHKTGGTSKAYSPKLIRKYRDEWYRQVAERTPIREKQDDIIESRSKSKNFGMLSTLAQHDVMRIRYEIEIVRDDWKEIEKLLIKLNSYGREFGYEVRREVLSAVYEATDYVRFGTTIDLIRAATNVVYNSIPLYSLRGPASHKITKKDIELIKTAGEIGFNILYDASKYFREIKIVKKGADLLARILRYAQINKLDELEKEILQHFTACEESCDIERDSKLFIEGKKIIKECKTWYSDL
ncbi:MAG: HNH endonuclease [Planctomycetes bacterium]|nr:HNH endonuclease [Planctomycetota bacterium]